MRKKHVCRSEVLIDGFCYIWTETEAFFLTLVQVLYCHVHNNYSEAVVGNELPISQALTDFNKYTFKGKSHCGRKSI